MSNITLYVKDLHLVTSAGVKLPLPSRPTVRWRERVTFEIRLPQGNGTLEDGDYFYAFDHDRDFLTTAPCNAGECTYSEGVLTFTVLFSSIRQAEATNGREFSMPFYVQVMRNTLDAEENPTFEYVLDDAIWVAGCVWDGFIPATDNIDKYYTKEQVDEIVEGLTDIETSSWHIIEDDL